MKVSEIKQARRKRRRQSVRRRLRETGSGVRLTVHRSLKHISARSLQIVGEVVLTALPGLEQHLFPEYFRKGR